MNKIEQLIEKIINDINKAMPAVCDKKVQKDIDNTYREILTKHLKTTEDICLRCGVERKEVKREGSNGCRSLGFHYPKHLWK